MRRCRSKKKRFDSFGEAVHQLLILQPIQRERGNKSVLRIYECPLCHGWHMTSKTEEEFMGAKDREGNVRRCQHCHGNGRIKREVKPGKWVDETCFACGGSGKVNIGLV